MMRSRESALHQGLGLGAWSDVLTCCWTVCALQGAFFLVLPEDFEGA